MIDIPQRSHGDDGVPEGDRDAGEGGITCGGCWLRSWSWDAGEVGAGDVFFGVEHDGREDDDGHGQREDEETELRGARLECVAEDTQTSRVAGELEYSSLNNTIPRPRRFSR